MSYSHLTTDERETIRVSLSQGLKPEGIANLLQRHKSTICREINRNGGPEAYRAFEAQARYVIRRTACRQPYKVNEPSIQNALLDGLQKYWSPE